MLVKMFHIMPTLEIKCTEIQTVIRTNMLHKTLSFNLLFSYNNTMSYLSHRHTIAASCLAYAIQAIVNNFAPLLFITLQNTYCLSIEMILALISVNFGVQLMVDVFASRFADKIGYRKCAVIAHAFVCIGLIFLAILPDITNPFIGILIATIVCALGGGLLEVVVSPIVESCPTKKKSGVMSLLHSFYCWGAAVVILISTIIFMTFGISCWHILAISFAALPIINGIYFCFVPIFKLPQCEDNVKCENKLSSNKMFWLAMLVILCAGASEHIISQWSSAFAETGLGITKNIGDLAGPFAFAMLMGTSRLIFSFIGSRVPLKTALVTSCLLCIASYLVASLSPLPILALIGCAMAGLSVGIMWPGTYSLASKQLPNGGTRMFAFLALAGDSGCIVGPALTGLIASQSGGNLAIGLLVGIAFPLIMLFALIVVKK